MIKLTIFGEPASKANSRKLVTMPRRSKKTGTVVKMPAFIKSEKARDYEADALKQIPPTAKQMLTGKLAMTIRIYYASERPDLDESVILDLLQAKYKKQDGQRVLIRKGVYLNDRQVRERHVYHDIDKTNPRAEIEIVPLEPQLFQVGQ